MIASSVFFKEFFANSDRGSFNLWLFHNGLTTTESALFHYNLHSPNAILQVLD